MHLKVKKVLLVNGPPYEAQIRPLALISGYWNITNTLKKEIL
jgi:hypothetical protein